MAKKFYITTTLPYVNAEPHLGFALEIVQADTLARYHRLQGKEVFFNFGTDEHGQKIYNKALGEGKEPQDYVNEYAKKFDNLKKALNLSYNSFIRTTDKHHIEAAKEFWQRCQKNGDIYKDKQKINYCIGCELEKTESELVSKKCPLHPDEGLEIMKEENYFFRFSKYQEPLSELYRKNPNFVVPESKFKEIRNFVSKGLKDFSISRLKKKLPWGVDVPGDSDHVMYVWFDALINYISAIGWPHDMKKFNHWWPVIQIAGKDNLRQQSAMWQAMLMSAGLPNSKRILIHGFISSEGQKMSKSLGNVVNPFELVDKYGTDAVRYYLLREIPPFKDGDFSIQRFKEVYNADLANGLGNLVARVAKLCGKSGFEFEPIRVKVPKNNRIFKYLNEFRFDKALRWIWISDIKWGIKWLDQNINEEKPWAVQDKKYLKLLLSLYVSNIRQIAYYLKSFLPETAEKIQKQFAGPKIKSTQPLFPRIE